MIKPTSDGNGGRVVQLTHVIAAVLLVLLAVVAGVYQVGMAQETRCELLAAKDVEIEGRVKDLEELMAQSVADRQQLNIKLAVIQAVIGTVGEQVGVSPAKLQATRTQATQEAQAQAVREAATATNGGR
jgi:hypothetical protein